MASKSCTSCLRTLQRQLIPQAQKPASRFTASRSFTTTTTRHKEPPEPNETPRSSIPPVTPERAERTAKLTTPTPASLKVAAEIKKVAGRATETYTAYGSTEILYKECARQADYKIPQAGKDDEEMPKTENGEDLGVGEGWWHTELGLQPTFSTWSQVTMLHIYLFTARFRCFPHRSQTWQQHLLDHFFYDAENRMEITHNMHARGTRNKYLKDLFIQWRGLLAAYDEGLMKGDAVLAAAIWRNVFKANEDVDIKGLAQIVSYMRRALKGLDSMPDEKIMQAELLFGSPENEASIVALRSKMMDLPFQKVLEKDFSTEKQSR